MSRKFIVTAAAVLALGAGGWQARAQSTGATAPAKAEARGAPAKPAASPATNAAPAKAAPAGAAAGNASQGTPAANGDLTALVGRVQAAYKKIDTLQANFSQSSKLSTSSKTRVDTGTLELKKGGKMRWDFQKPEARQFISDGKTLWIYAPADKQVITSTLEAGAGQTALNFMLGLGDLSKDFTPSIATEAEYRKPGLSALHLVPRQPIGTLKKLTILVSDTDNTVRETYVHDQMGTTTHIVFSDLKINSPIADARFSFSVPKGVDVIKPQF